MNQCFDLCGLSCSSEEIETSLTISYTSRSLPPPAPFPVPHSQPYAAPENIGFVDATNTVRVSGSCPGGSGAPPAALGTAGPGQASVQG